jgi:beta-lactamase class A
MRRFDRAPAMVRDSSGSRRLLSGPSRLLSGPPRLLLLLTAPLVAAAGCQPSPPESAQEAGPSPGAVVVREELESRIRAQLDALDARTALYAKHLPSGREVAIRADEAMNTLSVIKLTALVQAFREAEAGRLELDARHPILPGELRRGSGILQTFDPGLEPTFRDLLTQMIITSDNTATDIVAERLGLDGVNAFLESEGFQETRFRMTTGDLFREVWVQVDPAHAALSHREVYERGFPGDADASARTFALEGDSTRWLGRSTARETGRLLEGIHEGTWTSQESSEEMMAILRRQLSSSRLPRYVGLEASVAHKTGDWPPFGGSDVGILFHEGGPTVVAIYTGQNRGDFVELERTLGRIAAELVEGWR